MAISRLLTGTPVTSWPPTTMVAALNVFEAGERAQRGGLAAAGAAEQHDHFAGLDVQQVVERVNGGAGVDLDDVAHLDGAAAALDAVFEQALAALVTSLPRTPSRVADRL